MKVTTIKSARSGATTVHMGEDIGWGSRPFCPALATGRREVDPHAEGTVNCRPCIKEANARYLDVEQLIQISSRVRNLIKAVREHALEHYNTGAWDVVVEAYSDSELAANVGKCRTAAGAIAKVAAIVEVFADRRSYHNAEIAAATEPTCCTPTDECDECTNGSACVARCAHCGGTNSTPCPRHDAYDRFAEGTHPDGSQVRWSWDSLSGDSWASRIYPGKQCRGDITVEQQLPDGEYVTVERYIPAWRGQLILADCDGAPF